MSLVHYKNLFQKVFPTETDTITHKHMHLSFTVTLPKPQLESRTMTIFSFSLINVVGLYFILFSCIYCTIQCQNLIYLSNRLFIKISITSKRYCTGEMFIKFSVFSYFGTPKLHYIPSSKRYPSIPTPIDNNPKISKSNFRLNLKQL